MSQKEEAKKEATTSKAKDVASPYNKAKHAEKGKEVKFITNAGGVEVGDTAEIQSVRKVSGLYDVLVKTGLKNGKEMLVTGDDFVVVKEPPEAQEDVPKEALKKALTDVLREM